ncbi:unnamed protein product [Clavelina lepadiformis]|uniref:Uncharacterized protein n=1 Tax=Clavelina lepadiformis TaxID=159417 RepID=A0ABP0G658_CLALP
MLAIPIQAYGYKSIDVCLHESTCKFQFTFASTDIPHPILGADFLKRFSLLVDEDRRSTFDDRESSSFLAQALSAPSDKSLAEFRGIYQELLMLLCVRE